MAKVVVISWLARGRNDSPQGEIVIRWDYDGGGGGNIALTNRKRRTKKVSIKYAYRMSLYGLDFYFAFQFWFFKSSRA